MADFNNTNLADFSGVWVFCEQRQGELQPTVLELISEAVSYTHLDVYKRTASIQPRTDSFAI